MYFGGTRHITLRIITLLNCIFTYSASFQAVNPKTEQKTGMEDINSTRFLTTNDKQGDTGKTYTFSNYFFVHLF